MCVCKMCTYICIYKGEPRDVSGERGASKSRRGLSECHGFADIYLDGELKRKNDNSELAKYCGFVFQH